MNRGQHNFARRGLSLLESLMLVMILGVVGTGAGQALLTVARTPEQTDDSLVDETTLVSTMERMRGVSYSNLETVAGQLSTGSVQVTVEYADPWGGGYYNINFKKITVTAHGMKLVTFVSKP